MTVSEKLNNCLNLLEKIKGNNDNLEKICLIYNFLCIEIEEPEFTIDNINDLFFNNLKEFIKLKLYYEKIISIQKKIKLKHINIEYLPPVNTWFIRFNKGIFKWDYYYGSYILIQNYGDYNHYYSISNQYLNINQNNNIDNGYFYSEEDPNSIFSIIDIYRPIKNRRLLKLNTIINPYNINDINFIAK